MPKPTEEFKHELLRIMPRPPTWATMKQIRDKMGWGSPIYVKMALLDLAKEGRIAKFGPIEDPAFQLISDKIDARTQEKIDIYNRELKKWKEEA